MPQKVGRRLEIAASFYEEDFLEMSKQSQDIREYRRYLGLHHVQKGKSCAEVASWLGLHWRTVQNWVWSYRANACAGLKSKKHLQGKKSMLNDEQVEQFKDLFLKQQQEQKGGRLMARDVKILVKEKFDLDIGRTTSYRILHRAGLSWITGRDKHPKSDPEAQETFKKNL